MANLCNYIDRGKFILSTGVIYTLYHTRHGGKHTESPERRVSLAGNWIGSGR